MGDLAAPAITFSIGEIGQKVKQLATLSNRPILLGDAPSARAAWPNLPDGPVEPIGRRRLPF
jgi:hypothetical protein